MVNVHPRAGPITMSLFKSPPTNNPHPNQTTHSPLLTTSRLKPINVSLPYDTSGFHTAFKDTGFCVKTSKMVNIFENPPPQNSHSTQLSHHFCPHHGIVVHHQMHQCLGSYPYSLNLVPIQFKLSDNIRRGQKIRGEKRCAFWPKIKKNLQNLFPTTNFASFSHSLSLWLT